MKSNVKEDKGIFYTCPYCGEDYSNPVDLAHCILSCEEAQRKKEAEEKQKKLEAEKEARYKEIEEQYDKLSKLIKEYTKDYGKFSFKRNYSDDDYPTSFFWNKLFF